MALRANNPDSLREIQPRSLTNGQGVTLDAGGFALLSLVIPVGSSVRVSYVDDESVTSHNADSQTDYSANALVNVAWRYIRVSSLSGAFRLCLVA